MFKIGHALLLPGGRFSRPRNDREKVAEKLRHVMGSWPQTRHFRKRGLAQSRPLTESGSVHDQSESTACPSQRSRLQTIRVPGQATAPIVHELPMAGGADCPQTVRSCESHATTNRPRTQFFRECEPAKNDSRPFNSMSASWSVSFPSFVQATQPYEYV